ncbi:MAG TPA: hypothetical protein VMW50_08415 [Dehalococcoidia bacterium]|nr:hypothetical protein [Dehalococcoidia bacterium]
MKKTIVGYIAKCRKLNEIFEWYDNGPLGIRVISGVKIYDKMLEQFASKYKKIKIIVEVKEVEDD